MKNKKGIFLKTGAVVTSALVLGSIVGFLVKNNNNTPASSREISSYSIVMDKISKKDDVCTLFNVGNYNTKGVSSLKTIKKANRKNCTSGIVINTNASNKGEILRDAEYAKYIVENSDVDYPVYLDVEGLYKNPSLRIDEMISLISAFCSKLTSNNIFVGICASEITMDALLKADDSKIINSYDILLLDNDPNIELDVNSVIKTDENNNMTTIEDIKSIIDKKDLNKRENFLYDTLYELKEGESIRDVAFAYGLSVEDLLIYNDIDEKDMDSVKKFRIPTKPAEYKTLAQEENIDEKPVVGVDLSHNVDKDGADWEKLDENIEFAILRANHGNTIDRNFEFFATKLTEMNKSLGAFCYNDYITDDISMDEFKSSVDNQVKTFVNCIQGKNFVLPAYIDVEDKRAKDTTIPMTLTNEQMTYLLDSWYEEMNKLGYVPGIYTNKTGYQYITSHYKGDISKFSLWIAGDYTHFNDYGIHYCDIAKSDDVHNAAESATISDFSSKKYDFENIPIVQISECGREFGIGTSYGNVDVDVAFLSQLIRYADSETLLSESDLELLKTMEPKQLSQLWKDVKKELKDEGFLYGAGFGALSITVLLYFLQEIKKKLNAPKRALSK